VALQLTNILRDVLEDRERGRVYLPRIELARFGCRADVLGSMPQAFAALVRDQVARNREWYEHARPLTALLDPRGRACVAAMTSVYERILERSEQDPTQVLRGTIGLIDCEKARVAAPAPSALEAGDARLVRSS
jgi:phytoene synthase